MLENLFWFAAGLVVAVTVPPVYKWVGKQVTWAKETWANRSKG